MKKTMFVLMLGLLAGGTAFAQKNPAKLEKSEMKTEEAAKGKKDKKDKKAAAPATAADMAMAKPMPVKLETTLDSASYAYGMLLANQLKSMIGSDYKSDLLLAALNTIMRGEQPQLTAEASSAVYQRYNSQIQAKVAERAKAEGETNKAAGEAFLAENKKRAGVMTTASGLQYEVLHKGSGTESPKATDRVRVHYHGTNIDGSVFDSSVERGQPAAFGLNQVIKGWTEGLQLMHVGDKFKFFIPANLAYGERAQGPKIKANSALVFEVELLEINPSK